MTLPQRPESQTLPLRPESQAFDINMLSDSQIEACQSILEKFQKIDEHLKSADNRKNSSEYDSCDNCSFPVLKNNPNRVLLLTGGRGSGKTSVLLTLIRLLQENSVVEKKIYKKDVEDIIEQACLSEKNVIEKFLNNLGDENAAADVTKDLNGLIQSINKENEKTVIIEYKNKIETYIETIEKIKGATNDIRRKIIWLNPIEMETLPPSTNLLAAILSRIDQAVERFRGSHPQKQQTRFMFQSHTDEQDVLLEFSKLQQDVALSWNGNLEQRAGHIDTDVYAVEVLRAELNRINLNDRMVKCINELHDHFISDGKNDECFFVLPVDDFDINPSRCFELIRLVRMLNIPRLLTLILGDIRVISHILNLNIIESVVNLNREFPSAVWPLGNSHYGECRLSHELSSNALKKLFAPSNRIKLKPMTPNEVFHFKPAGQKETIKDLISELYVATINTAHKAENNEKTFHVIAGRKITSLFDFFNIQMSSLISPQYANSNLNSINKWLYIGRFLFRLYPRHVQDLWIELKKSKNDSGKEKDCYIQFAEKIFRQKVREGRNLTLTLGEKLINSLYFDFANMRQIDTSFLKVVYTYGEPISIIIPQQDNYSSPSHNPFYGVHHPKSWLVKMIEKYEDGKDEETQEITLTDNTAAALIFLHDMLAFSQPKQITGTKLLYQRTPTIWAYTQWPYGRKEESIKIAWPFPPWLTMFECDILRRCWVEVWAWVGEVKKYCADKKENPENLKETLFNYIPFVWVKLITEILKASDGDKKSYLIELPNIRKKNDDKTEPSNNISEGNHILDLINNQIKDDKINDLIINLNNLLVDSFHYYERRTRLINGWFAAIGCLLAPECNFPKTIIRKVLEENAIIEKFQQPFIANEIRLMRTQAAVQFFDSGATKLLFDLFEPRFKYLEPDDTNPVATSNNIINQLGHGCLCPFIEDIVSLSTLTQKIKDKNEERLSELIKKS